MKLVQNSGMETSLGFFGLSDFRRDGELVQLFVSRSIQGSVLMKSPLNPLGIKDDWMVFSVEVNGEYFPIDLGVPFLEPRHSKDNLGMKETDDHKFNHVSERSRGKEDITEI